MIDKRTFSGYGGWMFLLLCIILLMGHSANMITLYSLFCIFFITKIKKLDGTDGLLIVFSLCYIIFSFFNEAITTLDGMIIYGLPWFVFYNYGKYVGKKAKDERRIIDYLLIVALVAGLPVYFTTITKIIATGSIVDTTRDFYIFGDEAKKISGNLISLEVYMGYIGLAAFFILKEFKLERWLFLGLFVLSILVAFNVVSRFPIVTTLICFLIVVLIKYRGKPGVLLGVLVLVAGALFILFMQSEGMGQVWDAYSARNADMDNVRTFSDRSYRWTDALEKLYQYPFGWYGRVPSYVFVHNMWLDIAKYSGCVPFVLLVILTIRSFVTNVKIFRTRESAIAYILFALNLCFCVVAFVEPIYGGIPVSLCCLVWGIQSSYLNRIRINSI